MRRTILYLADNIIISDKLMPEIVGTEFLREIAEKYPASCHRLLTGTDKVGALYRRSATASSISF